MKRKRNDDDDDDDDDEEGEKPTEKNKDLFDDDDDDDEEEEEENDEDRKQVKKKRKIIKRKKSLSQQSLDEWKERIEKNPLNDSINQEPPPQYLETFHETRSIRTKINNKQFKDDDDDDDERRKKDEREEIEKKMIIQNKTNVGILIPSISIGNNNEMNEFVENENIPVDDVPEDEVTKKKDKTSIEINNRSFSGSVKKSISLFGKLKNVIRIWVKYLLEKVNLSSIIVSLIVCMFMLYMLGTLKGINKNVEVGGDSGEDIEATIESKFDECKKLFNDKLVNHQIKLEELVLKFQEYQELTKIGFYSTEQIEKLINKRVVELGENEFEIWSEKIVEKVIESLIEKELVNPKLPEDFREQIMEIIKHQLILLSSDNINKTDFALATMGGEIVDYSDEYGSSNLNFWKKVPFFFKIRKWLKKKRTQPEAIIDPYLSLGECFALDSSKGYMTIKVPISIIPDSFSIDHVPKSLSPDPTSAIKKFRVWGYFNRKREPHLLGEWEYDFSEVIQTFTVEEDKRKPYITFKLEILSNHGNKDLTCIYRFRIHGKRAEMIKPRTIEVSDENKITNEEEN